MVAYFSCKLTKQINALFAAALLSLCLLGTHWIGLTHSISHAGFQGQALVVGASNNFDVSLSHSSDACHLFDALSLASFIPSDQSINGAIHQSASEQANANIPFLRILINSAYQSRAPPTFIL
jgi:hypothetical protein